MNYIIFDLEWNQGNKSNKNSKKIPFEIVEIGAVKLNSDREMVSEFSELVKPQIYTEMNYITSKIVHLHMKELEKGEYFEKVIAKFMDWCGDDVIFCTWGSTDLTELQRNMEYYKCKPLSSGPIKYLDIQKLFSMAYEDGKSRKSLEYAIDLLSIKKDIPFHRAFSDAYYTAKVFYHIEDPDILEKCSFDCYHIPSSRENEVKINFKDYSKHITRGFAGKQELLNDKEISSTYCFKCKRKTRKKENWFSLNGKHYIAISSCLRHGYIKSKIRIRKYGDNVYAIKTEKYINKQEMKNILQKKEEYLLQKKCK